jgi:cytochrome oxidase Cu insertion factor (SCO1/SenC/PrrC family)
MSAARQARVKLLLLAALFFAPVVGAFVLYFYLPQYIPQGRLNYGTLVSPARPVPALALGDAAGAPVAGALQGKWSLVYLGGDDCAEACQARLVLARQVRLALNQNRGRVQRVYVAPSAAAAARARETLVAEHPDLVILAETEPRAAAAFFGAADPDALYLVDPLGNWLMTYAGVVEHKGLHRDLKKLLRVSRVG